MNKLARVIRFSFTSQMRNKSFIISTVILSIIVAAVICIPTVINLFNKDDTDGVEQPGQEPQEEDVVVIVDLDGILFNGTEEISAALPGFSWRLENDTPENLAARIEENEIIAAAIVRDDMNVDVLYFLSLNIFVQNPAELLESYLQNTHRAKMLDAYGVSGEDAVKFFEMPAVSVVPVGMQYLIGQTQSLVFILLLYMTLLTCGVLVSTSVGQEKSSRAMEVLITTAKPEALIFGKIIGVGLAGLAQMTVVILSGVLSYWLNRGALAQYNIDVFFDIPPSTAVFAFVFFVLGFFFYAMIFGAIGSLVSRIEDLNSAQGPIMLFTVAGFLVAIYGQLYGFADSLFYKVCSYIPFTSPYVMMARISGEPNIPAAEIWASLAVLLAAVLLTGWLSAKIYRVGVLMYGKKPSMKELIKATRQM
ncbi:MAG: ABC transporter permease [Oscillospiraceae bacterium]|jgi:ABC-2 type transport system permease protein|nr:ABC transporter permease [Oscillospiraceae bacterium]